ncbi:MAG: translation elongation factor Ts [Candidatus Eisenbacteria bacterium]|nr:translation elongation factor Ts [Candidatus Eisenbacteria bacterium]
MEITAALVMQLREKTGAGVMDCKVALAATGCDVEKAVEHLRKSGVLKAAKRADRATGDGLIVSYVHPGSKLAVLVEINCETDFVARTEQFQTFAKDIAMHVAAQNPVCVGREDVPEALLAKEREIYLEQARATGKPENVLARIVDGRVEKFFSEACLMEQPFVKNPDVTVSDLVKQMIASFGENIRIRRFVRMKLGEDLPGAEKPASDGCGV